MAASIDAAAPWLPLLAEAVRQLDRAGIARADWRWGGGTVLAVRHRHRVSHDIDIFLHDAQLLGLLTPRLNDLPVPHYTETANLVRLDYGRRQIDYIVAMQVLPDIADETLAVPGIDGPVLAMPDEEIVAKKLHHRAAGLAARDLFDFAVAVRARLDRFAGPAFLAILRNRAAMLRHFLARESLPAEYAAIESDGRGPSPTLPEAAALLREWLARAEAAGE